MVAQLTLRPAHIAETARLGMLAYRGWEASLMGFFPDGKLSREKMKVELVLYCIGALERLTVAEKDGELAGWAAREANYVPYLWIAPTMQREGIGSTLLFQLEADMIAAGHRRAVLDTIAAHEAAIRFYQRAGYEIVQRGQSLTRTGRMSVEKVRLIKVLKNVAHNQG
ncbi:MAG: GNAT family N-acetyltransferase [Cucumibacter sp.]